MSVKRVLFLSSLLVATLFAQDASATLQRMLPESSHYQGFTWYNEEWERGLGDTSLLRGRIDFAVYDTLAYPNEFIGDDGYAAPGDGRYIYAYQIFNDYQGNSQEAVTYFAALGIDMAYIYDIDSQEDPAEGIEPTDEYFSDEDAVWEFGEIDQDWIIAGEHSWFLAYSSDKDWVRGDYEIRGTEPSDFPVPEPAMLTLLSIGGAMLFRRKNISGRQAK
ncbi:MAG: PEP-CTERM sorting domain-containing protein [Planctomycetota bacterium]|jgi:hypothetical protein